MKTIHKWGWVISVAGGLLSSCMVRSEGGGSEGAKVFLALGICLAAVFVVFYIVVKGREKD
jgi:predicted transporter